MYPLQAKAGSRLQFHSFLSWFMVRCSVSYVADITTAAYVVMIQGQRYSLCDHARTCGIVTKCLVLTMKSSIISLGNTRIVGT